MSGYSPQTRSFKLKRLHSLAFGFCCEMWPGNTADVRSLIPVVDRIRKRFHIGRFCVVADRGMISEETIKELDQRETPYILGARMRKLKEIREEVLTLAGRYREVYSEGKSSKDPAPLKVKEVWVDDHRYILCLNVKQTLKEALDQTGHCFEWADIKQDLKSLQEITIEEHGTEANAKGLAVRSFNLLGWPFLPRFEKYHDAL